MTLQVSTNPEPDRIELPTDVAEAFQRPGDQDNPPDTLRDGFAIIQRVLDEGDADVGLEDMYQSAPTRHAVDIGERVEHVPCVMDAMIVALTLDTRPIEIRSEPPTGGETVHFHVTGEEVTVTPENVVVSFGLAYEEAEHTDLANVKALLNEDATIPSTCSVINAFPDVEAYERWAEDVSNAAVMALDVEELVAISRRAVEGHYS